MSIITRAKTVLSPAVAGLTLLVLAASPTLANTHNKSVTPNQSSSPTNEVKLTQQQINQRTAPRNQTTQQNNQMGCACCQSMMNNMPKMMNNTPGMMNNMPGMTGGHNNLNRDRGGKTWKELG